MGGGQSTSDMEKELDKQTGHYSEDKKETAPPTTKPSKPKSKHTESAASIIAKKLIASYIKTDQGEHLANTTSSSTICSITRRTVIHMLFHHYDRDESRELSPDELVQLMLELIRSSTTSTTSERNEATSSAAMLLKFLDTDGDTVLEELEFVDFIVEGMSKDPVQQETFAKSGEGPRVLVDFLQHFS